MVLFPDFQVHKRFDPIYSDARMRIQKLGHCFIIIKIPRPQHHPDQHNIIVMNIIEGEFNFFTSYMSQPKFQLETFKVKSVFSKLDPSYSVKFKLKLDPFFMYIVQCGILYYFKLKLDPFPHTVWNFY